MNTYNIYPPGEPGTIIYHAVAESEQHVMELAEVNGIDMSGLVIEVERRNVRPEYGKSYRPVISVAIVE